MIAVSRYYGYFMNLLRVLLLKMRNPCMNISCIQRFRGKVILNIKKEASVILGRNIESNNSLYIKAVNGELQIGDACFFNNNVSITAMNKVWIGNKCTFGNNVVIVDHDHDINAGRGFSVGEVYIGENVWVGANVVILKDTYIGNNAVIGAGSVVKGRIPENSICVAKGSLAQIVGYRKEGEN